MLRNKLISLMTSSLMITVLLAGDITVVYADNKDSNKQETINIEKNKYKNGLKQSDDFTDFEGKDEDAKKWSDEQFDKWEKSLNKDQKKSLTYIDNDIEKGANINTLLERYRYNEVLDKLNKTDVTNSIKDIDKALDLPGTKISENIILHSPISSQSFDINKKDILEGNSIIKDKYEELLKDSQFGQYNGYLKGNLSEIQLDKDTLAILNIKIPSGSNLGRIDNDEFILPKGTCLEYTGKSIETIKGRQYIVINAKIDKDNEIDNKLEEKRILVEKTINDDLSNNYSLGDNIELVKLKADGMNADETLSKARDIVKNALSSIPDNIVSITLNKLLKENGNITITDGSVAMVKGIFENLNPMSIIFYNNLDGYTLKIENQIFSAISTKHTTEFDNPTDTFIHEFAHIIDYQHDLNLSNNETLIKCFDEEKNKLIEVCGSDYGTTSYQEFFAEAFRCKYSKDKKIVEGFIKELPMTNQYLDSIKL